MAREATVLGARPQGADRQRPDPFTEFERVRSGVEDDPAHESLTELFAQPPEMLRVTPTRCGRGLDLDADDTTATQVQDQVHLVAS